MKTYRGTRTIDGVMVTVDDLSLDPRLDLRSYSRNGFEWSYEGAEPLQLAFALLFDHLQDASAAEALAQAFMRAIVANFDNDWIFSSADMTAAIAALGRAANLSTGTSGRGT